jgi:hypothetical protein
LSFRVFPDARPPFRPKATAWGSEMVKGVEIDQTIIEEFGFRISADR